MALIGVEELRAELAGPNPPLLLDVRWPVVPSPGPADRAGYLAAHLPGAVFVDLDADLAAAPAGAAGGRHPLPTAPDFTAPMRRLGVSATRSVVVYDAAGALAAARAWWCLRYFGHPDVRVLDGGLAAWTSAGLPTETGDVAPASPGDFTASTGHLPVLDIDAAASVARRGVLLDARSAPRYRGESDVDVVRGHIPGAVSAPTFDNVDADGRWLSADALRERFDALVPDPDVTVGVSCGSGVTATHTALAMVSAGLPVPAIFVGSWSQWSADPDRPVATGAERG